MESVDATNAQLALSGMYVRKSQKQLLAQEEGEKSKEDGGQVKGTFGRVVTHKGFVKGQGVCAQKKITEAEMDQLREEAKAQWKGFNDTKGGTGNMESGEGASNLLETKGTTEAICNTDEGLDG